jgi:hypothetical protein
MLRVSKFKISINLSCFTEINSSGFKICDVNFRLVVTYLIPFAVALLSLLLESLFLSVLCLHLLQFLVLFKLLLFLDYKIVFQRWQV